MKHERLISVVDFYFSSRDFNGIPLEDLYQSLSLSEQDFKLAITTLVRGRKIDLIYEGDIPNPHIKPFPAQRGLRNHIKS